MSILNQPELLASIASNLADNSSGDISAEDLRGEFINLVDSLQSYSAVIDDGNVPGNSITATPTKWLNFSNNVTTPNDLLEADVANDCLIVKEPALYFLTFRFEGQWPVNEDLRFEFYVNGVPNVITPVSFAVEGKGATDPDIVSVTDIAFIINSAAIAAGPGGVAAEVCLYVSSDTGTFTLDQLDTVMGMEYNPLSIRTVG